MENQNLPPRQSFAGFPAGAQPDPRAMQPPMASAMPSAMPMPAAQSVPMPAPVYAPPVNPLMKHFRQPVLYIKLTSEGTYWPEGALEIPITGDLPVYPMTARDEIILRTPDALVNGTSVVQVIQSCVPGIKDAWKMPSVDVDSTLIAIRIASYGQYMSVSAKCPHCGEEHDYDVDLHKILADITMPHYDETIQTADGLTIKLKPISYMEVSQAGNIQFEEERLIQAIGDPDMDKDVRSIEYDKHIKKMIDVSNANVTNSTDYIICDGQKISDKEFISEYYRNVESSVLRSIKDKSEEFATTVSIKSQSTMCTSCNTEFKLAIDFDYASFFASGS